MQATDDEMLSATQEPQHASGIRLIDRFAEDISIANGYGVTSCDDSIMEFFRHRIHFVFSQAANVVSNIFAGPDGAFVFRFWCDGAVMIAEFG